MEAFLTQVSRNCPFLRRTPTSALRQLSTTPAKRQEQPTQLGQPRNALVAAAHQCPVMSKAIAIKQANEAATRNISTSPKCPYAAAAASAMPEPPMHPGVYLGHPHSSATQS